MEDRDRGPDKAGLKKLCTMAKAILPPPSKSPPDNDVEMHNLQSDTSPHASTETASASDINYYVEKETTSVATTGKHSVLSKRRTSQISPPAGTALVSKQSPENEAAASACPVDQRDNEENSSTKTKGDKKQPEKSINPIETEVPNPVSVSTTKENLEATAAGATAKFDVTEKPKNQITNKSVQKREEMKSSSRATGEKEHTVKKSTTITNAKSVSTTRSRKMGAGTRIKKNVGESDKKGEDCTPQISSIKKIGKPTVMYKPDGTPNNHEDSTGPNKKTKKLATAPMNATLVPEEDSPTSTLKGISTDDDSLASMRVQFSWEGSSAAVPATEDESSNQGYENKEPLEAVTDFRHSSKSKKLAVPVEGDESINALLAPESHALKTPIEPFLTEENVSDIASMNKKTQIARAKYISSRDSVFTIDTNWETAPNVVFDIEHQKIRPETSPGRINFAMDFYNQSYENPPSELLVSEPHLGENKIQERKRSLHSADWRSHENAYAEAPELYSLVVLEPVTPPNETDAEFIPEETGPQSDATHDVDKTKNPEELASTQLPNRDSACQPDPHSTNKVDPAVENLPSTSTALVESSPEHWPQPSNDSTERVDNSSQDAKTTLRRRGSAEQEEINQYLDNLEDGTTSPTRTVSPGIFWSFFQLFGMVLNIFKTTPQETNEACSIEKNKQNGTTNGANDNGGNGRDTAAESRASTNPSSSNEKNKNSEETKNEPRIPSTLNGNRIEHDSTSENGIGRQSGSAKENGCEQQSDATSNSTMGQPTTGPIYRYKDLFTCFTNKMFWCGVCPNKVQKPLSKFFRITFRILATILMCLSFVDSLTMIKIYAIIFFQNKELHDLVALVFLVGHACTKGYFLFMVTFRWEDLIAFVPIHRDIMYKCCDSKTLEAESKNNELIGNFMSISTIIVAFTYALVSKFDLCGSIITLGKNLRLNAAAMDVLAFLWELDRSGNRTRIILNHHSDPDIITYETAAKGAFGESMQFAGEAHDSFMLDMIVAVNLCLRLTTMIVVKYLKRTVPEGQDPVEFTNWQWKIYGLLRLLAKTINCTFGIIWLLMHYRNLVLMANFGFQIVWEPGQVVGWFQGSDIAKLAGIYYLGIDTFNQNTHIKKWIRGVCSGKTEVELGGEVYNVIVLIDDVYEHPIGFGVGRSFINNDFIFGVVEKVSSFFIMLVSFRQKPCECEKICEALAKTFADTLNALGKH